MSKVKTVEQFKKEIFNLVGEEYSILDEYTSANNKLLMRHNNCATEYMVTPNNFLAGKRCPRCSKINKHIKQHDTFIQEVFNKYGNNYKVIGTYINAKTKILLEHSCGTQIFTTPNKILTRELKCNCGNIIIIKSDEYYRSKFNECNLDGYTLLDIIREQSHATRLLVNHDCGHQYTVTFNNFLAGKRCPKCALNLKPQTFKQLEIIEVQDRLDLLYKDKYIVRVYNGSHKISKIHCNNCNIDFDTKTSNMLRGSECPNCTTIRSVGERQLINFFDAHGIQYSREYSFPDLRSNKNSVLRFDFAIFNDDGTLRCLIEYDGVHHFYPTFGLYAFNNTITHDLMKNKYCVENGITLYRIRYFDNLQNEIKNIL